ncbi:hypothetical protein Srufu_013950 [Streptomyces libani subsp. rufus]|nr:hypothetical protein Srufu_013950 [Streptomyces libani subsp. rufus]
MGMQGDWAGETIGPDVRETCRELILPGSVFAFLAEHRETLFSAVMFAYVSVVQRATVHAAPGADRRRGAAEPAWPPGVAKPAAAPHLRTGECEMHDQTS